MKNKLSILLVLIALGSISAQNFIGKINPIPDLQHQVFQEDTLKILGVMVNFQEDRDGATFGNGKFGTIYSQNYGNDILDPLPHDKNYFESHLEFVKNYFNKVSNGQLTVVYTILPDTFSVSKTMRNYSPPSNSDDFTLLGEFASEVWTIADGLNPSFNFSEYDLFIIFHAGVGRDISLPGSLGNERDLPSVYLGTSALRNIFGNSFSGYPVSNGNFNITNSAIIPETESRELQTITGTFLFEITINGLLAATVGSFLGLPDLFDTETGLSAIGRFGLMDGQSIFAYNGVFPPEPSAWEKIRLGWANPVELKPGNYNLNLITNEIASLGDTTILKIPLNSTEYYLVENLQRDALNNGAVVSYRVGQTDFTKIFTKDTTGFLSFDTDSLAGVITDVDEYNWAIPGNGILVWHIDESVINAKISQNQINTDKNLRGVDVEEADGIQDIGERFFTIFGDEVIGEGTEEDLWFASNPADLYQNKFSKDTRPSTITNSGANSLISFSDFSEPGNRMNFKLAYGDSIVKPVFASYLPLDKPVRSLSVINDVDNFEFAILADKDLLISDGATILQRVDNFSNFKVATAKFGAARYVIGCLDTEIKYWFNDDQQTGTGSFDARVEMTAAPVIRLTPTESLELLIGTIDGRILVYDLISVINNSPILKDELIVKSNNPVVNISASQSWISAIANNTGGTNGYYYYDSFGTAEFNSAEFINLASTINKTGNAVSIILSKTNNGYEVTIQSGSNSLNSFKLNTTTEIKSFALADLKNDGENYLIINDGQQIKAFNMVGALADNFPFTSNNLFNFTFTPLSADIEGDKKSELISFTSNGDIFSIDGGSLKVISSFPISAGDSLASTPVLFNFYDQLSLAVLTKENYFTAWTISTVAEAFQWAEENGSRGNNSFIDKAESVNSISEFFPETRTYNYPNPVYEGTTAIRYFVQENSQINIKIFDLSGDLVAELSDNATGGLDNETIWNVGNIQSGVYLARVEAISESGKTQSHIIKIAIVK